MTDKIKTIAKEVAVFTAMFSIMVAFTLINALSYIN